MEGAKCGPRRTLCVQRDFETSRLEQQLWAAAYESVVPLIRQRRPRVAASDERKQTKHVRVSRKAKGA